MFVCHREAAGRGDLEGAPRPWGVLRRFAPRHDKLLSHCGEVLHASRLNDRGGMR